MYAILANRAKCGETTTVVGHAFKIRLDEGVWKNKKKSKALYTWWVILSSSNVFLYIYFSHFKSTACFFFQEQDGFWRLTLFGVGRRQVYGRFQCHLSPQIRTQTLPKINIFIILIKGFFAQIHSHFVEYLTMDRRTLIIVIVYM